MWPRRKRKKQNQQAEGQKTAEPNTGAQETGDTQAKAEQPPKRRYGWVPPPAKPAPGSEATPAAPEPAARRG